MRFWNLREKYGRTMTSAMKSTAKENSIKITHKAFAINKTAKASDKKKTFIKIPDPTAK